MEDLLKLSIFERLSSAELADLHRIATRRSFATDNTVFFEGDPSDSLHVILSGSAKVYTTSHDGQQRILKILGKGEIFGELAMLDGHPRSATVTCTSPTEMLTITRTDFKKFAEAHPGVLWKILEALCERMRRTSAEILQLSSRDVPYRLLAALVQLANTHGETRPDGCWINIKLTSRDLASMVGSNRESVSRLLEQFQTDGLLSLEKNAIRVPDMKRLGRALEYASDWS